MEREYLCIRRSVYFLLFFSVFLAYRVEGQSDIPKDGSLKVEESQLAVLNKRLSSGILSLEEAITLASYHNYNVRQLRQVLSERDSQVVSARGRLLPKVVANSNYTQTDPNRLPSFQGRTFGVEQAWNADLEIQQQIFAGGKVWDGYVQSKIVRDASRYALDEAVLEAKAQATSFYYGVALAKARIGVNERLVALRKNLVESEQSRLKAGTVSRFNVLRAEVSLANAQPPLIRARNDERISREDLSQVIGLPIDGGVTVERIPLLVSLPELPSYEKLVVYAELRPDLKRLAAIREAEDRGISVARADIFPELALFGSYGAQGSPFSNSVNDRLEGWRAGVRGSWKLFDSGDTYGAIDAARARKKQAEIALEDRLNIIRIDVRRALSRLQQALELVSASQQVVIEAEESLRLARAREEVGAAIQLDVLQGQLSLAEAETNQIEASYEYYVALADLARATGVINPLLIPDFKATVN